MDCGDDTRAGTGTRQGRAGQDRGEGVTPMGSEAVDLTLRRVSGGLVPEGLSDGASAARCHGMELPWRHFLSAVFRSSRAISVAALPSCWRLQPVTPRYLLFGNTPRVKARNCLGREVSGVSSLVGTTGRMCAVMPSLRSEGEDNVGSVVAAWRVLLPEKAAPLRIKHFRLATLFPGRY